VSLSHIAKVLITKFDRGFSSTTMEEQSEWDYNVPVSIKQKEVLDTYWALSGIRMERVVHLKKTEK